MHVCDRIAEHRGPPPPTTSIATTSRGVPPAETALQRPVLTPGANAELVDEDALEGLCEAFGDLTVGDEGDANSTTVRRMMSPTATRS